MENTQEIIMFLDTRLNYDVLGYHSLIEETKKFKNEFKREEIVAFLDGVQAKANARRKKEKLFA
jgi:hypothetical protein